MWHGDTQRKSEISSSHRHCTLFPFYCFQSWYTRARQKTKIISFSTLFILEEAIIFREEAWYIQFPFMLWNRCLVYYKANEKGTQVQVTLNKWPRHWRVEPACIIHPFFRFPKKTHILIQQHSQKVTKRHSEIFKPEPERKTFQGLCVSFVLHQVHGAHIWGKRFVLVLLSQKGSCPSPVSFSVEIKITFIIVMWPFWICSHLFI